MSETFDPYYRWLGIGPEEQPPHYYRLLGILTFEADPDVIANAADRQMAFVRSFQAGPQAAQAQKLLEEILSAQEFLLRPEKKTQYDQSLRQQLDAKKAAARTAAAPKPAQAKPAAAAPAKSVAGASPKPVASAPAKPTAPAKAAAPRPNNSTTQPAQPRTSAPAEAASPHRSRRQQPPPKKSKLLLIAVPVACVCVAVIGWLAIPSNPEPAVAVKAPAAPDNFTQASKPEAQPTNQPTPEPPQEFPFPARAVTPPPEQPAPTVSVSPRITVTPAPNSADPAADPLTIDNTEPGYKETGTGWYAGSGTRGVRGGYRVVPAGTGSNEAIWTFTGLTVGATYAVQVTWVPSSNRATKAVYLLSDLSERGATRQVSQVQAPSGNTENGVKWETLGAFTIESDTVIVRLSDAADGFVVADAARVLLTPGSAPVAINPAKPVEPMPAATPAVTVEASPTAPPANVATAPVENSVPQPVATAPASDKLPLPDPAQQDKALQQIKEVFKTEFANASKPDGKVSLANFMLTQSASTGDDAAASYVLLTQARELAAQAGEVSVACSAQEKLAATYAVPWSSWSDLLAQLNRTARTVDARREVATRAMTVANSAAEADEFEVATTLAELALASSIKVRDLELGKTARARRDELKPLEQRFKLAKAARDKLKETPDDPEANATWGRYLCLSRKQWAEGLPLLARGNDAQLTEIAKQDMAEPQEAEKRAALADGWWDLAESDKGASKAALQARAKYWYEMAMPGLGGLAKIKVEKRLSSLEPAPPRVVVAPTPRTPNARGFVQQPVAQQMGQGQPSYPTIFGGPPTASAERRVAETVVGLQNCGVYADSRYIRDAASLPTGDFTISHLNLHCRQFDNAGWALIGQLKSAENFYCYTVPMSSFAVTQISRLKCQQLTLNECGLTDEMMGPLRTMDTLRTLNLDGLFSRITDAGMDHIAPLTGLTRLGLDNCAVGDVGARKLANLKNLISVDFTATRISDNGLKAMAPLPALEVLVLQKTNVGDQGLTALAGSPLIHLLSLNQTQVSDTGLKSLTGLVHLNNLNLDGTRITSAGIKQLTVLPALTYLNVSNTAVSDEAIDAFLKMPILQQLYLSRTNVTLNGLAKLKDSKTLRTIYFSSDRLTPGFIESFQTAAPNIKLQPWN